jgi:D-alanyl-lipoteichoic acid acyltransferase DltB (MBOAT superfamily)
MSFISPEFFIFTGITYALLWSIRRSELGRLWLLTIASYVFYAWYDWRFCGLMFFVTANAYVAALLLNRSSRTGKWVLAISIGVDLAVLATFKYFDFFLGNLKSLGELFDLPIVLPTLQILLPVGISFYTFHAISYVVDVWRGKARAEKNFVRVALYIAFFPQLIAGPILRASFFMPQLRRSPPFNAGQHIVGLQIFLRGFIYKIVADQLANICDPIYADIAHQSDKALIIAAFAFYGRIYFDFAGYSGMAIGTARLFGYRIPKNFNYPYSSLSATEFWRRWHISLSSWLRDYLYIPLGGNRQGVVTTYRNLLITMVLGGLWHGASWNFVFWGLLHGIGLCAHKIWSDLRKPFEIPPAVALLITQVFVFIGWIFFRVGTPTEALRVLSAVVSPKSYAQLNFTDPVLWIIVVIAVDHILGRTLGSNAATTRQFSDVVWFTGGALFALGLMIMPSVHPPFIYFKF